MRRPRILLADDHRILAEGLRGLLEPEFDLVGIVENGRDLVESAERLRPDVIVADITMPRLNGIEAVRRIKQRDGGVRVIVLTMHPDVSYAVSAIEAGAQGYVLKHSAPSELNVAIREVLKGNTYITPLLGSGSDMLDGRRKPSAGRRATGSFLTPRQMEVVQLLAEGLSVKEIAAHLDISPRTVEYHKYQMLHELNLRTVADLVRYAVKHGIVGD